MEQNWEWEELVESFTLNSMEIEFLSGEMHNQLGQAVLLKTFQYLGRFPDKKSSIPADVVDYIAKQLLCEPDLFTQYNWEKGRVREHRHAIRQWLGFREITTADKTALKQWVINTQLPNEYQLEQLQEIAQQHLRESGIEQTMPKELNRLLRSAVRGYETRFFRTIQAELPPDTRTKLNEIVKRSLKQSIVDDDDPKCLPKLQLRHLKTHAGKAGVKNIKRAANRLSQLQAIELPDSLLATYPRSFLQQYSRIVAIEAPSQLLRRRKRDQAQYEALLAIFCWLRQQELTDDMVDLFIHSLRDIKVKAESRVERELIAEYKRVRGKDGLFAQLAETMLANPDATIREVVFPIADEEKLKQVIAEFKANKIKYRQFVRTKMHLSYGHHYRQMLPDLLRVLRFRSNNQQYQPLIDALALVEASLSDTKSRFPLTEDVPMDDVVPNTWQSWVLDTDNQGRKQVRRTRYELVVLQTLRDHLRCKEMWVEGANRYRNPDADLPSNFDTKIDDYLATLGWPTDVELFIEQLKTEMETALQQLHDGLSENDMVEILERDGGWIKLTPFQSAPPSLNWERVKQEVKSRWDMTELLDILKEVDLQVNFSDCFNSLTGAERLPRAELQRRLLLCLFGLGTNTGLAAVSRGQSDISLSDLKYIRQRFIHRDALRQAIAKVANAIFDVRQTRYWGSGVTAVGSDSKQFASWSQNIHTQWHKRYRKYGIMVYWSVEKHSTCIYSQLKSPASSEVASMITGILNHCTSMEIDKSYVDSHGQSLVGFAFCHLLGFDLMPRLKDIHRQKLMLPTNTTAYPKLSPIIAGHINWDLIRQQYLQMMKYTTAMRLGIAEPDAILQRFRRENAKHPTYKALQELGKAVKTIFLCRYLHSEAIRREISASLNVVENWNSANKFILYGKSSEIGQRDFAGQELVALSLHLLQICMVYVNTMMVQEVLDEPAWSNKMTSPDWRAMTPLFYKHINPYGTFTLDMASRIPLHRLPVAV